MGNGRGCLVVDGRGRVIIACGCGREDVPFIPSRLARLLIAVSGLAGREVCSQAEIAGLRVEIVIRKQFMVVLIPYSQGQVIMNIEALHIAHMLELMYKSYFEREQDVREDNDYCARTELSDQIELEVSDNAQTLPAFLEFQNSYLANTLLEEPACKKWLLPLANLEWIFQVDLISADCSQRFLTLNGPEHKDGMCSICKATTCSTKFWSHVYDKVLALTVDSKRSIQPFQWNLPTHHDHELSIFLQPVEARACGFSLCLVVLMMQRDLWALDRKAAKIDSRNHDLYSRLQERMEVVADAIAVAFPSSFGVDDERSLSSHKILMPVPPKRQKSKDATGLSSNPFRARHLKEPHPAMKGDDGEASAIHASQELRPDIEMRAREQEKVFVVLHVGSVIRWSRLREQQRASGHKPYDPRGCGRTLDSHRHESKTFCLTQGEAFSRTSTSSSSASSYHHYHFRYVPPTVPACPRPSASASASAW